MMMKRKRKSEALYQKDITEILVCKYCTFETENIDELDNHISSHEIDEECEDFILVNDTPPKKKTKGCFQLYSCPHCDYSTKRKHDLPKHLIKHSLPGSTTLYRCSQCAYETKRKNDMPKHMLAHCTDVQMFKCPECPYQTKRKNDLPKHLLCHKPSEEVDLYKCDYCDYVTKRKGDLPKHVLNHKDFSNLEFYDCSECDYRTKRKNDLHKHMLIHCDRHVAGVFKCLKCSYATEKVHKFSKHVLSDCRVCEDVINIEHLMLEDIIASVEGDDIQFVGGSDDEEDEYKDIKYLDLKENECSGDLDNEQFEDSEKNYDYNTKDSNLEMYENNAGIKHGIFNINLGEFCVDTEANSENNEDSSNGEHIYLQHEYMEEES